MSLMTRRVIAAAALAALGPAATGFAQQPVVDGTRDAEYGSALAVQTVNTGFGDNLSEMDAAYATVRGDRLYLMLTGNIEANFNKLEIFIDSAPGGENALTAGGIPDSGVEASANNAAGLTFDTGFAPDYWLFARRGSFGGDKFDLAYVRLGAAGAGSDHLDVFGGAHTGSGNTGTGQNTQPIGVAYDNSNTAGVNGATGTAADQAAAEAVTTGLELSIALADLGNPAGELRVAVLQNNSEHNYLSNQSLAGLPVGTGNLGSDGAGGSTGTLAGINLNNFAGDQFFTVVVPEPASMSVLTLAAIGLLARRRWQA